MKNIISKIIISKNFFLKDIIKTSNCNETIANIQNNHKNTKLF